jgi:glucosamine 6-phosphate synthetase-like amidotransferase/phosphosugar isomerase protein
MLAKTARDVRAWLDGRAIDPAIAAAGRIALRSSVVVLGSDYGLPIAREAGLKLKEACYLHAEGFAAGEFRHGSVAMIDASCAVIGIIDADAYAIVARPMREVERADPSRASRTSARASTCRSTPSLGSPRSKSSPSTRPGPATSKATRPAGYRRRSFPKNREARRHRR